eukprot:gb/GECH01012167.1/.p1 GENE.gb/GECH01012167.1/~~gb/GECH01012167.1/.p1  ORF type:complete len:192 (+),score=31.05 gb/GECH01012167.1/:1-576(+)
MSAPCGGCGKTVYMAEWLDVLRKKWHKRCLKCNNCNKTLSAGQWVEHKNMPYCKHCHGQNFRMKGYGFGNSVDTYTGQKADFQFNEKTKSSEPVNSQASSRSSPSTSSTKNNSKPSSGAPTTLHKQGCARCGKPVYFNEKLKALGYEWHKRCFKCTTCGKTLGNGECRDHKGLPYCKKDYDAQFKVTTVGF